MISQYRFTRRIVTGYCADPVKLLRLPGCNGCFYLLFVLGPDTRNLRSEDIAGCPSRSGGRWLLLFRSFVCAGLRCLSRIIMNAFLNFFR